MRIAVYRMLHEDDRGVGVGVDMRYRRVVGCIRGGCEPKRYCEVNDSAFDNRVMGNA